MDIRPEPRATRRGISRVAKISSIAVAVVVVGGLILAFVTLTRPGPFDEAVTYCHLGSDPTIITSDDGKTLILDMEATESAVVTDDLSSAQVACVLGMINTPDSVLAQMDRTRSLDGRQSASWDHFTASWTYHPDNGLDVILTSD